MSEQNVKDGNFITRFWKWIWGPAGSWSLGIILLVGFAGGIMFWGSYNWAMELSNTETFCISCHEMKDSPFKELKKTVHYSNKSGVRAICSDCHVPREWQHKFIRKIKATNELFHTILGTVDTPEKYEANRLEMATNVWREMKETDSRECRNCHSAVSMKLADQSRPARKKHQKMIERKQTCIDCHQGIAHELPENWEEIYEKHVAADD